MNHTSLRQLVKQGSVNVGWTEAGCIAGNDYYPDPGYYHHIRWTKRTTHWSQLPQRHYVPQWRLEESAMYAEVEETGRRLKALDEYENAREHAKTERKNYENRIINRFIGTVNRPKQVEQPVLDLFNLDWDASAEAFETR
jgi:hypothetical protein